MARNNHLKKLRFAYRDGARPAVPAEIAGRELRRINARDGSVSAAVVVQEARPDDAPLHPAFEWDDERAAEKYRVHQARNLIRSVMVVSPDTDKPTPAYVHVPVATSETRGPGYYAAEVVAQQPDLFAAALNELVRRTKSAEEAAQAIQRMAATENDGDAERMARIAIAIQALHTANSAVTALQ